MDTDELNDFVEFVQGNEVDDLTNDDFDPKVMWFDKGKRYPRLTMFPRADGDWIEPLPWPMGLLSSAQEDTGHIAIISDSMGTSSQFKHDGTPWGPGGMQHALVNKTVDADLVYEVLMIMFCSAEGVITEASIPYHRHDDGPITYDKITFRASSDKAVVQGRLPTLLRHCFAQPKLGPQMLKQFGDMGLTPAERAAHGLAIAVKMVMNSCGWICAVGAESEGEQALLKASFEDGPLSENIRAFDKDAVAEIVSLEESLALPDGGN